MDMVTISGCKSEHKLCSECIYDKTECPVCKEDLGLVHCDICYEYKKELVDTGCKNKHQTCKDCLQQIQKNKRRRELNHNIRNGYHRDTEPYYFKYKCPFCRDTVNYECGRAEYYDNYSVNDYGYADYESDEEFWRRDEESLEDVASPNDILVGRLAERLIEGNDSDNDGITMHMEDLRTTYPSRRLAGERLVDALAAERRVSIGERLRGIDALIGERMADPLTAERLNIMHGVRSDNNDENNEEDRRENH
jgi:hypothetical protein